MAVVAFNPIEPMRSTVVTVLAVWALCPCLSPLAAQTPDVDPIQACARALVPYADLEGQTDPEWSLHLDAPGGGHLTYVGAVHARDPLHPQFAQIKQAWQESRPTVAFYEGPARPIEATAEATIAGYGESGYVRFLAQEAGVRIARLEPSPQAEFAALQEVFPLEQIKLFYVLRETTRLREHEGLQEPALKAAAAQLLDRAQAFFGAQFGDPWTLADLEAAYRRYWSVPEAWWLAPSRWFSPKDASSETGGIFTNDVNRVSSEFRNRHMYTVLAKALLSGERVFAVVGRDHIPAQAPALRCTVQ